MKKILSLFLAIAILSGSLTAFADIIVEEVGNGSGGFGDNNVEVEDTLGDEEIEASLIKPLYFNDFENSSNFANYYVEKGYFTIKDTEDAAYGKAVYIGGYAWTALLGNTTCGKYTYNGVEYTVFNEPLTPNTDYILAFQRKTTDLNDSTSDSAFSFAPQIPDSKFVLGNDYIHEVPLCTEWETYAVKFNSKNATEINIKLNTLRSTAITYIDNYGIYEPVKLTINGIDADLNILSGVYTDGYLGKGAPLIATAPQGLTIKSATMGGRAIEIKDGKIDIQKVTGDIKVEIASGLVDLNKNYLVKNGYVYVPKGQSITEFVANALSNEDYTLTDAGGNAKPKDGTIYPDDKLSIKVSATATEEFGFKYLLDAGGTNSYVVSDVVYLIDCLLGNKVPQEEDDINGSGTLTVSDLVLARNHILTAEKKYIIDETKLATEKAKITEDAAKYGITDETLARSLTNAGNRSRVANVMKKALRGENITIATIGGSITEGGALDREPVGKRDLGWAPLMAQWWERMFPGQVTFVNAGISGTLSMFGNYRLEDDVLCHNPDLLFVEFAVNDGGGGGSMRRAQESIIRRMLESGGAAIQIFFTAVSYNGGGAQPDYQPVGEFYNIPQISPRDAFWGHTFSNADGKTYDFAGLTYDGTHPNVLGNAMVAVLTNNYFNSVYESLNEISSAPNAIPEKTYDENTENFMIVKGYDAGEMEQGVASADGKVTVIDFGDFQKNTDSNSYYSHCKPMTGVNYSSGTSKPIVIEVDDCHVFGILSQTETNGAKVKVEVYKQGTNELIKTDVNVDTNYGGKSIRSHLASFESVDGIDVTIKITPIIESGRTVANLRTFYIS